MFWAVLWTLVAIGFAKPGSWPGLLLFAPIAALAWFAWFDQARSYAWHGVRWGNGDAVASAALVVLAVASSG